MFQLLGDMLLDRSNSAVMIRYVSSLDNMRILMNLLRVSLSLSLSPHIYLQYDCKYFAKVSLFSFTLSLSPHTLHLSPHIHLQYDYIFHSSFLLSLPSLPFCTHTHTSFYIDCIDSTQIPFFWTLFSGVKQGNPVGIISCVQGVIWNLTQF